MASASARPLSKFRMLRFTLSSRSEARDLLPTPFQLLLSLLLLLLLLLLLPLSLPFASVYVVIPLALTKEGGTSLRFTLCGSVVARSAPLPRRP
jgi:hypothetical protein